MSAAKRRLVYVAEWDSVRTNEGEDMQVPTGSVCIVLVAAALTVSAGCGSDDNGATNTTAAGSNTSAAEVTEATDPAVTATADSSETSAPTTVEREPDGGAEWAAIVEAAEAEGAVTVYAIGTDQVNGRLESAFETAYPAIDMEVIRVLPGEVGTNLDSEERTGAIADVAFQTNYPWIIDAADTGRLAEIVGPNARSEEWEGTPWLVDGLYQYSAVQPIGIACNTDLVESCPTTYEELLDPKFKGLLGMTDPQFPVVMDYWAFLEGQLGEDGLENLALNEPIIYSSGVPAVQALVAGEYGVYGFSSPNALDEIANGAPLEWVLPGEVWAAPFLSYIPSWAAHPNAAQVVLDFLATSDGQASITAGFAMSVLPEEVPGSLGAEYGLTADDVHAADIYGLTTEWHAEQYERWQQTFGR
jgi:iron(III) transport system substrate-binding protein